MKVTNKNFLILSDLHLSSRFDEEKYAFLVKIISACDTLIINGDFWDNWLTSFSDFLNSKWQQLFPLLKSKHTIYICGNHDLKSEIDSQVCSFCDLVDSEYRLTLGARNYTFLHGDQLTLHKRGSFTDLYYRILNQTRQNYFGKYLRRLLILFESLVYFLFPDFFEKTLVAKTGKKTNAIMKAEMQKCRNAEMQKCRNAEMQKCRNAEMPSFLLHLRGQPLC